jgi:hypothetical protein
MGMGMGMGMHQYGGGMTGQAEQQQQSQPVEAFDDAAFARAFEEASREELERSEAESRQQQVSDQAQTTEMSHEVLIEESAERFMSSEEPQVMGQDPIGADRIQDPNEGPQDDPDALAQTAAHLLDSVRNNKSEKFANSEFLELMRAFRDKELRVQGDKIIDTNGEQVEGDTEVKVQA